MSGAARQASGAEAVHRLVVASVALWHQFLELLATQPLFRWSVIAMALVLLGGIVRHSLPALGGFMRFLGNFGLILALMAVVLGLADVSVPGITGVLPGALDRLLHGSEDKAVVEGDTTRIPLADDGHFWVKAKVNGIEGRFLIDTGATLTTLSSDMASFGEVRPGMLPRKIALKTANGMAEGDLVRIRSLRVGNVVARRIDAVIAPGLGKTNVLGMNFLTRLASWRVEGNVMVLVPHHPAKDPPEEAEESN